MTVETWDAFVWILERVVPVLPPSDKKIIKGIITWVVDRQPLGREVKQADIDDLREWLLKVIARISGQAAIDLTACYTFLGWINKERYLGAWTTQDGCLFWGGYWWGNACHPAPWTPKPADHKTPDACKKAGFFWYNGACHVSKLACINYLSSFDCTYNGCYWYDNACHGSPEPAPPPPPPPPAVKKCSEITNQTECLTNGCYWYKNACHKLPEPTPDPSKLPFAALAEDADRYCQTIPLWDIGRKVACHMFRDILKFLDDFFASAGGGAK